MFRRVGLELELLTPRRHSRVSFARALARRVKGRVEFGFKYFSEGTLPDGRPLCRLSSAARVVERSGRVLVTLVDDNTIRAGLPEQPAAQTLFATDELRLALLAERLSWSPTEATRLRALQKLFDGFFENGALHDAFGNALVIPLTEPRAWHRVCEVVTRPLVGPRDRRAVVDTVLATANELGCTIPPSAALHAHYDAAPWRDVKRLSRPVVDHAAHRDAWCAALPPHPGCPKPPPLPPGALPR